MLLNAAERSESEAPSQRNGYKTEVYHFLSFIMTEGVASQFQVPTEIRLIQWRCVSAHDGIPVMNLPAAA